MSRSKPLAVAASHPALNSRRSRGHVIVLPGRGESAGLYQRLGNRLAFDGYTVTVVALPSLAAIDAGWLDEVALWDGADDAGPLTIVGSDSGAPLAAYLARRLGIGAAILAGIGGTELAGDPGDDDGRIAARSYCPLYRDRLADGGVDLAAPSTQRFAPGVAAVLANTELAIPVLAVHGEDDPVTPLDRAVPLYQALAPQAEIVTVRGGLHDILNDVSHRSVSAEIVQFLERRERRVLTRLASVSVGAHA